MKALFMVATLLFSFSVLGNDSKTTENAQFPELQKANHSDEQVGKALEVAESTLDQIGKDIASEGDFREIASEGEVEVAE